MKHTALRFLIASLLILVMALPLFACDKGNTPDETTLPADTTDTPAETPTEQPTETPTEEPTEEVTEPAPENSGCASFVTAMIMPLLGVAFVIFTGFLAFHFVTRSTSSLDQFPSFAAVAGLLR